MKKRLVFIAAMLMVLCSCAGRQPALPQESGAAGASSEVVLDDSIAPVDFNGVKLCFVRPDEAYDILGTTAFGEGYAVIYQRAMPDSFNKIYSRDDVFYNLSTQLFTREGIYLKTVDSLRHNAIKITEPVLKLTPNTDTITFEGWRKNEAGKTEATRFTLALTGQGIQALGYNPNNNLYAQTTFVELSSDGETQLQYADDYDYEQNRSLLRFRLASQTGESAELSMPYFDASFSNALHNTAYGGDEEDWLNDQKNPLYVLDVSLDVPAKTAALSNGKIFCRLDFGGTAPGCSMTRSYTEAMLGEQVAISPDGTRRLYTADARHYFESPGGCDYVVRGPEGIVFLYAGSELDQLYFLGSDRVFVNTFDAVRFYDAASGEVLSPGPEFDLGTQQNPYNKSMSGMARIVVGTAVDEANRLLLIAHRPYTFGSGVLWQGTPQQTEALPVTLTVLDWDGRRLRDYDAGMTMHAFAKFSINVLSVKTNGDGTADVFWGDDAQLSQPEQKYVIGDGNRMRVDYMA